MPAEPATPRVRSRVRARVRSFDVFDTVLTRRVGDPEALLDVLADRLSAAGEISAPAAAFAAGRRRAERELTRKTGRYAALRDLYAAVADSLNEPAEHAETWARAEEDHERELTVAVPGAADLLAAARAEADLVVFVSDTPHSESFVRELLERAGLVSDADRVFTSAGRPCSKADGGFFLAVARELEPDLGPADYQQVFHHIGDNRRSDVAGARVEGWSASWEPRAKLTRYERLLEQHAPTTGGVTSWLAGASRLARLEAEASGVPAPVAQVSAGAFAPMLVGYALWVAGQARLRGIKRLYFVARDGAVMLDAARHVLGAVAPELELRFLHGSRQPWIFGAAATSEVMLERWVTPRRDFTARTALARVALTAERAHELTGDPLTDPARQDVPLSADERERLAALLRRTPLVEVVRAAADRTAQETLAYLRQEGLLDGVPSALVDAGWEGRTAAAFDHVVRRGDGGQAEHLVIGTLPSAADPRTEDGVRLTPWLFDRQRAPEAWPGFPAPNLLVEMLCAGTTGRTVGYRVDDDQVRPVLAAPDNQPVLDWGLPQMQAVAVRTAELVAPRLTEAALHLDLPPAVEAVLRAFWTDPSDEEARAWGSFPWEEEIWPPYAPVAQRLTTGDVVARLRRGDGRLRRTNSWRAGSAAVSGQPWRTMLRLRAWQEAHQARLARLPRRLRLERALRRRRQP
jgi:FMN phosphatase YigB (HAD superfamily)